MFTKSAEYYDALYHFKDYATASNELHALIQECNPRATTLLDVACGTAKHLEFLQQLYRVEGVDIQPELLKVARKRCPDVSFHEGDMVSLRLNRTYDVVTCLFSSIGYVRLVENLNSTIASMAHHLEPGGVIIIEPWFSPKDYWAGRITANFVDQPELKIAWMYTSEIEDSIAILNINYLVGTPKGVEYFTERHEMGLFTQEEYLTAFQRIGFAARYEQEGFFGRGMYIATRG